MKDDMSSEDETHPEQTPENAAPENAHTALEPESEDKTRIAALESELDKTKDQMLRALAEAENARKRALKEREDAARYSIASFSKDLLNVADNLRRALEAVPENAAQVDPRISGLIEGIEATERELLKSFEKTGIRRVDPIGENFNPNFHEVMFEAPGTGKPAGTVIQVIETGYTLHDRLLRPARVGVAKDEGYGAHTAPPPSGGNIDTEA